MRRYRLLAVASVFLAAAFAQSGDSAWIAQLPTGDRWIQHLTTDLAPFWTMPAALGSPLGSFPSTRCDDGSLLNFQKPCAPIAGNPYLMTPAQYLVPLSRQTYGYGVAFHLTGDPKYLAYMKAGIDYLRQYCVDPAGGMYLQMDLTTHAWGPQREFRDPQQLGYGLLGLAMYYYLTRDDQALPDILAIKKYIETNYYNPSLGANQWLLRNNGSTPFDQKELVADLDQMNTYLVLLAPILPEPAQTEWKQTLTVLTRSMLGTYYSPPDNLFFTAANTRYDRDLAITGVDYGHTSKALWMTRWTGLMLGDQGLTAFAESAGKRHLDRAFLPEDGSWAGGVLAGGQTDKNKNWWVYAELDQFSGTLALGDARAGRYLPQTQNYWFQYFVDPQYGEVWNGVNYGSNTPQRDYPKAWQWKSAYHDFEHVLVGYLTSQYLHGQPAKLHYAIQKTVDPAAIHPYYFPGTVQAIDTSADSAGTPYQTVTFTGPMPAASAPALATVSAASFLAAPLAAGSIAAAFGSHLASSIETPPAGQVFIPSPGTQVSLKDSAGTAWTTSLYSAAPGQVNFLVPPSAAAGPATLTIAAKDGITTTGAVQISAVSPGIFQLNSGGLAAANLVRVHADLSQSYEAVYQVLLSGAVVPLPIDFGPATDHIYLTLWTTGLHNAKSVAVTAGGQNVPILYWGPQLAGVEQVNIGPLPRSLAGAGMVNLILNADGQTANPVMVSVK